MNGRGRVSTGRAGNKAVARLCWRAKGEGC